MGVLPDGLSRKQVTVAKDLANGVPDASSLSNDRENLAQNANYAIASVVPTTLKPSCALVASQEPSKLDAIPLLELLLKKNRVPLSDQDTTASLQCLERLQKDIEILLPIQDGKCVSPGFFVKSESDDQIWFPSDTDLPYEMLRFPSNKLVLPSANFFAQCYKMIHHVLSLRKMAVDGNVGDEEQAHCSCISRWEFFNGCVAKSLVNQTIEQLMVEEASASLSASVDPILWNARMEHQGEVSQDNDAKYLSQIPVRLLCSRDEYLATAVELALAAESSIQVNTCYLDSADTSTRYIMLDLLPHCIRKNGISVQVLVDLMTIEGAIVKSAFY